MKTQEELPKNPVVVPKTDENIPTLESKESISIGKNKEKRINFESKRLEGSINLYGATFDELFLKDYFRTIGKNEKIQILSNANSAQPYFLRSFMICLFSPLRNRIALSTIFRYSSGSTVSEQGPKHCFMW